MQKSGYINYYFDTYKSFAKDIGEETLPEGISERELLEYGLMKNKLSGVGEVNISCKDVLMARELLKKYSLCGKPVVSDIENIQQDIIFHIDDILSFSEVELEEIVHQAKLKSFPIMVTFGRSLYEMGQIDKTYGQSPATFLESLGVLDRQCIILGANYIDKDDLSLLASYDARIVVTPISDMQNARGFVNLAPILNQGLQIGFASDDSPKVDILSEARLAAGQTSNLLLSASYAPLDLLLKFAGVEEASPPIQNEQLEAFKTKIKEKLWK